MTRSPSILSTFVKNDLAKHRVTNVAIALVLTLCALLTATGTMVLERLTASIGELFEQAKPPHFLQMHTGDYDEQTLAAFAAEHPELESWLIVELVGFDGSALSWRRPDTSRSGDFSDSLIENLFVTQNEHFDYLIDERGTVVHPVDGELYVPVAYQQQFALQTGDVVTVRTDRGAHDFTVAGFIRDSQMASSLSSATRFLVSPADLAELQHSGSGEPEIIVEYLLTDPAAADTLSGAYESNADLPRNGPAVTYQAIRMINTISDGLVAIALILVSLLLIAIALINVRFVIRGTLEDEVQQIGALKAVGVPNRTIARLYLAKYALLTLVGCVAGGLLALAVSGLLTAGIERNYAAAPLTVASILAPIIALLLVFVLVLAICRSILGKIKRIHVVNALVHGSMLNDKQVVRKAKRDARRARRTNLASARGSILVRLTLIDLRAEFGQWLLIPVVFFLAAIVMAIPMNLLSTFESPQFVSYMGSPAADVRADIQYRDDSAAVRAELAAEWAQDARVEHLREYANVAYEVQGEEGWETLRVGVGEYHDGDIQLHRGTLPSDGEIALSVLNADKLGVGSGDSIRLRAEGREVEVTVSGVYQDVTNGGLTAKMQGDVPDDADSYVLFVDLAPGVAPIQFAQDYRASADAAAIIPMRDYVEQTLSHVTSAFRSAAVLSFIFGVSVAAMITVLFLRLQLTKSRAKMGVLSALGFSAADLRTQVVLKTLITVTVGTALGILFAATVGEAMVGGLLSVARMGLSSLSFLTNPLLVYVAYPLVLISLAVAAAFLLTSRLAAADKSAWIRDA